MQLVIRKSKGKNSPNQESAKPLRWLYVACNAPNIYHLAPAYPIPNSQAQPWKPADELERAVENRGRSAEPSLLAWLGACVFVREPFQKQTLRWEFVYKWLFKEFSKRKKKKAVASSRKQERKGKEAKQMRDFRPNPKLSLSLLIAQSCPALCNPMDCSPPGSSVHGILQTRKLERVAIFFSKGSPYPGIEPGFPAL